MLGQRPHDNSTTGNSFLINFFLLFLSGLLCISTSERLLRMPSGGQNHFFSALKQVFPSFSVFFCHKRKKEKKKKVQKITKNMHKKGVYQHLGATPKCWLTPGEYLPCRFPTRLNKNVQNFSSISYCSNSKYWS